MIIIIILIKGLPLLIERGSASQARVERIMLKIYDVNSSIVMSTNP